MASQPYKQQHAPTITTTTAANNNNSNAAATLLSSSSSSTSAAAAAAPPPPPNLHLESCRRAGGGGVGGLDEDSNANDDSSGFQQLDGRQTEDMAMLADQGAGSRRPSTASLSRFRSCPQLASVVNVSQDSPGCDMAPMMDADGNVLHTKPVVSKSNNSANTLQVERPRFELTSTPTPPSTPGSRRKDIMSSSYSKTQSQSNGNSPSSTPKLSRRSFAEQTANNLIPRTISADSHGGVDGGAMASSGCALTCENLLKLDELCLKDSLSKRRSFYDDTSLEGDLASDVDDASSMHLCGRNSQRQYLQHPDLQQPQLSLPHNQQQQQQQQLLYPGDEDDGVEKCNRWLQGLKLTKSDKIKSRSHIQLPAI